MTEQMPCDVFACVHPAYIAVTFESSPRREYYYCQVHDARTEAGPRARRRNGWAPSTIKSVRRISKETP